MLWFICQLLVKWEFNSRLRAAARKWDSLSFPTDDLLRRKLVARALASDLGLTRDIWPS